jgi:hypothetical protein
MLVPVWILVQRGGDMNMPIMKQQVTWADTPWLLGWHTVLSDAALCLQMGAPTVSCCSTVTAWT